MGSRRMRSIWGIYPFIRGWVESSHSGILSRFEQELIVSQTDSYGLDIVPSVGAWIRLGPLSIDYGFGDFGGLVSDLGGVFTQNFGAF